MDEEIQIRLKGQGVKPGLIRSKELAEILESVEDLVVAEALKADHSLKKDEIIVGLYAIEDRSIGLKFKTTFASIVIPAFISTAQAIEQGNFESLNVHTIKSLQAISSFARKHDCEAEFSIPGASPIGKITPQTEIPVPFLIEGISEITGKVVRVGGKKPRAMIELTDGATLYCDVEEEIAKELGHRLYSLVKFSGLARWNSRNYDLEEFQIKDFEEFPNVAPNQMFESLSKEIGHCFAKVTDVNSFVASLRREGGPL